MNNGSANERKPVSKWSLYQLHLKTSWKNKARSFLKSSLVCSVHSCHFQDFSAMSCLLSNQKQRLQGMSCFLTNQKRYECRRSFLHNEA